MMQKKPIMSQEVERQVLNAVTMFTNRPQWISWGLNNIRKQGAAILMWGEPGTGKTVIANWLALQVRQRGLKEVAFADFGSKVPGENARQIRKIFDDAKKNKNQTLFLDECDAILWSRQLAGGDSMWMLEVINELLIQIAKYPGLVILATNNEPALDPALERRLLAKIHVTIPGFQERVKLWSQKLPSEFPVKPPFTLNHIEKLAEYVVTGAEIENIIIECASDAIRQKQEPTFDSLCNMAKKYHRDR